jgi:hypothetical protein
LNDSNDDKNSIVQRIVDGRVAINTVEEFEKILNLFPNDPRMLRAYGDLLFEKGLPEQAVKAYGKASQLFIENDKSLQAIVAKILQWSIVKPTHAEGRIFHNAISESRSQQSPLQNFFARMAYPEMVAIMLRLVRVRFPAHQVVIKVREVCNDIYFVVSGTLKETTYLDKASDMASHKASSAILSENDILGEIIPLGQENRSKSDVETLTRVELVKISKPVLMAVCRKYPKVELLINELYRSPSDNVAERSWQQVRKTERHEIPIKVSLRIFRKAENKPPLTLEGFTKDISLGGACIDLGAKYWSAPASDLMGQSVEVTINLPSANTRMDLMGKIAWSREVPQDDKTTLALGIEFKDVAPADQNLLTRYCLGSDGEQNLIWSLWESFVKK